MACARRWDWRAQDGEREMESARWRARDGEREMESGRCRRVDNMACDTRWAWRARDGEWSLPVVTAFESASGDCTAKRAANDIGGIGGMIGRAREQMDSNDVHCTSRTATMDGDFESRINIIPLPRE